MPINEQPIDINDDLTPEEIEKKKKRAAEQARYYAKKKHEKEGFLELVAEEERTGLFYKSECRSAKDLWMLYLGQEKNPVIDDEREEEEEWQDKKAKNKTRKRKVTGEKEIVKAHGEEILGQLRSFPDWLDLRDKARKDLFWLGSAVLRHDLVPEVHQIVCDQFVRKNFDGCYKPNYTLGDVHKAIQKQRDYRPERDMLLLDPRGFYKSTINSVDSVQWLLVAPDVRIMILTGSLDLAKSFLGAIKSYFYLAPDTDPTDFHRLFPEYVIRGTNGTSQVTPLKCPARIHHNQKEQSLWVKGIECALSGWHCDVKKGDDVVNDDNCETEQARRKLKKKFDGAKYLLDQWGFDDTIGTRYFSDDYYGSRIAVTEKVPLKYFRRQCWTVKSEFTKVPLKELTEDMVVLTFPQKATWKSLQENLWDDEIGFRCQQLNEPAGDEISPFKFSFTEDMLRKLTKPLGSLQPLGDIVQVWDTALTANARSDFSVGITARIFIKDGKFGLSVLEIVYGKFTQTELAYQIVKFAMKWNPRDVMIEKLPGAELFIDKVNDTARNYGYLFKKPIWWKTPSHEPDAKRNRVKGLEILMVEGLFEMASGLWIDETYKQFCRYTGIRTPNTNNKGRKDDICDAAAQLLYFIGYGTLVNPEEARKAKEDRDRQEAQRAQYQRMFGGAYIPVPTADPTSAPAAPQDPRNRIFGGNGMHI